MTTDVDAGEESHSRDLASGGADGRPSILVVSTVHSTIRSFLLPYAEHLRAKGWRVEAAAAGAADDRLIGSAFDLAHDLPLTRSLADARGLVRTHMELGRVLTRGYDIMHVHTPIAAFVARATAVRMPSKTRPAVVYTAHGFHFHKHGKPWTNALFRTAERVAGRWTDRLIVINREDYLAARKSRLVPSRSLVYMPGIGIDTDFYSPTTIPADRQADAIRGLGIEPGTPFFVVVGELNANKRPEDVLIALSHLKHREAGVVFLGDGPRRGAMEALAAELGVADRVTLPGTVSDVRPVVAASAALLLVSRREGLPRSIMEALSMEVPVIASDARGSKDLVGAGAGTVVPIGEPITLAAAMDQVLDDPGSAREAAKRGRVRMADRYDVAKLLDQHDELYASLLAVQR